MKATYSDFLNSNPNCSSFANNNDAMAIFDFLSKDENIISMIEFADQKKPALIGCVIELEKFFDAMPNPLVDFNDGFTRTVVGRMVKAVLEPFGYTTTANKDFPRACGAKYFTSAMCYSLTGPASMRVVKHIEEI